jgi:hypothetical protein
VSRMRREIVTLCERCTKDKVGPSESPCKQEAANCQATSALLAAPTAGQSPWPLVNGPALP